MSPAACLLVIAKAPVAGFAKTRLCPPATPSQAAAIAAAGLLDTLDAVLATRLLPVVALAGELARATEADSIAAALSRCTVIPQRGDGFAARLANAHADTAALAPGASVLQIGSDTPQLTAAELTAAADALADGYDAVLGPATDGGWWALGVREPHHAAAALRGVEMSTPDTGRHTLAALDAIDLRVGRLPTLSDVDTMADAVRVSRQAPDGRFARTVAAVLTSGLHPARRAADTAAHGQRQRSGSRSVPRPQGRRRSRGGAADSPH